MIVRETSFTKTVIDLINAGSIGIIRTDTIYGIIARADNEHAVARVYETKGRTPSKSPIVLISSIDQLFDHYQESTLAALHAMWPGKNSIILPSESAPSWIRRSNESVAYRMPNDTALRELISVTGPLIAPSANPEGLEPAYSLQEAENYFKESVDFYVDGGVVEDHSPSRIYKLQEDKFEQIR